MRPPSKRPVFAGLVFSFPLTILYERQEDVIYIAAVMHRHRKPGYWKDRLLT